MFLNPSTCECSRDVVLDLDVHEDGGQSERHVALTVQADVMETCGPKNKPQSGSGPLMQTLPETWPHSLGGAG